MRCTQKLKERRRNFSTTEWPEWNSDGWNNPWNRGEDPSDGGWMQMVAVSQVLPSPSKITNASAELQKKSFTIGEPFADLIKKRHPPKLGVKEK